MANLDNNGTVVKVLAFDFDWSGVEGGPSTWLRPSWNSALGLSVPEE